VPAVPSGHRAAISDPTALFGLRRHDQTPTKPQGDGSPTRRGRLTRRRSTQRAPPLLAHNRFVDWFGGLLIVLGVAVAIWLVLVAFIWQHGPSRHLAGAGLRLLPDVLRMLRALVAARPRHGASAGC